MDTREPEQRHETTFFDVDGVAVHTRIAGRGPRNGHPPVVLVHGLSISSAYMVPTLELLGQDFEVLAPDLPGFGKSGKPEETLDIPALAEALLRWMDAAALGRVTLLGNSLGCQVIAEFAARYPERVERVVLVGPTMDPSFGARDLVVGLIKDAAREDPRLLAIHAADDIRAGPVRTWETFQSGMAHDVEAALARVRAPTLVVRGTWDPLVTREWAERVARLVEDGTAVELAEAPHALNYSAPERLVDAIRPFLLDAEAP